MYQIKGLLLSGSLTVLLLGGTHCRAAELPQAVTKEAVLQWVKAHRDAQPNFHPGETLNIGDLEKLRPFLPPGYYEEFRFPEVAVRIIPTGDYSAHPMYQVATEKYAGQTRVAQDGMLLDYVAGQPFPNNSLDPADPLMGLKAAWNFNFRWQRTGPALYTSVGMFRKGGPSQKFDGLLAEAIKGQGQFHMGAIKSAGRDGRREPEGGEVRESLLGKGAGREQAQ